MRTQHWKDVFRFTDDTDVANAFTAIADLNRTSWQYLLPPGTGKTALCVGDDMGATTHALSANYTAVVTLEPVLARVEFMRRRFEQDGVDNVCIVRSGLADAPFASQSFDLVAVTGIDGPAAVAKAFKLLKPGGHVYFGIENRWRCDWVHRGHRRSLTWLMSAVGCRRVLRKAGFQDAHVFIAKESHIKVDAIVPVTGPASRYFFRYIDAKSQRPLRRLLQSFAERLGFLGHLQYAFIVIGRK